jgi:hypothetical protein
MSLREVTRKLMEKPESWPFGVLPLEREGMPGGLREENLAVAVLREKEPLTFDVFQTNLFQPVYDDSTRIMTQVSVEEVLDAGWVVD